MIVDDEILTRIGIESIIDWNAYGFIITENAENGRIALEIAEREQPDIILTDIKMPVMGGIEFIQKAKELGLKAKFIILSSYSDFYYVREGMKLGAEDYLLKLELEPDKLLELLNRIADKIHNEKNLPKSTGEFQRETPLDYDFARKNCLCNILAGLYENEEDIIAALEKVDISIKPGNLICIAAKISKTENMQNSDLDSDMSFSFDNTVLHILKDLVKNYGTGYGCVVKKHAYCMVVSINADTASDFWTSYQKSIETDITEFIKNTLGLRISAYISEPVNRFVDLPSLFGRILIFLNQEDSLSDASDTMPEGKLPFTHEMKLSRIDYLLSSSSVDELDAAFCDLIHIIDMHNGISTIVLYGICHTLIHIIDGFVKKNSYLENSWSQSDELLFLVKNCKTKEQYIDYIYSVKDKLHRMFDSDMNPKLIILKAKKYIEENYMKEISLGSTAHFVNLCPTYFSHLFSKEAGVRFIDYLTDYRVELAKEYLKNSNMKVNEISERVGYNNSYYFCRIFKKVTGITPLKYRK